MQQNLIRRLLTSVALVGGATFCRALTFFGSGARFSKLPVITGPVKLFCFPF